MRFHFFILTLKSDKRIFVIMSKLKEEAKDNIASEPDFTYGGYTYADYLKFDPDYMVEVIRGKLFQMSPAPGSSHQEVSSNLHGMIWNYLKRQKCRVYPAPFDVILPVRTRDFRKSETVVQPDLSIICDLTKIQEKGCFGPPDWIIEIISPNTSKKDLQDKYDVYEEAGVKEYWIVMPKSQIIEIFVLDNHRYRRVGSFVQEDTVSPITLPDLKISLEEVFGEKPEY